MHKRMIFSALFCLLAASVPGNSYYVSPAGNDITGTGALDNPVQTIGYAINLTTDGDEVVLLPGTFTGPGNQFIVIPPRALTIRGSDTISTHFIQPEPGARVFDIVNGSGRDMVFRDFTILGASYNGLGGGVADMTPQNLNTNGYDALGTAAGGAVFIRGSAPSFINVVFFACQIDARPFPGYGASGGAVWADGGANPLFQDCRFTQCAAYGAANGSSAYPTSLGGAVGLYQAGVEMTDCQFDGNLAQSADLPPAFTTEALPAFGGAISFTANNHPVILTRCSFTGNRARSGLVRVNPCGTDDHCHAWGGAVWAGDAGVFNGCDFQNNLTGTGGAVALDWRGRITARGCLFSENFASVEGLAISNEGSEPYGLIPQTFEGCVFQHHGYGYPAAAEVVKSSQIGNPMNFVNCTFYNNRCLGAPSMIRPHYGALSFTNSTFFLNEAATVILGPVTGNGNSTITIGNSLFGAGPTGSLGGTVISRGGNVFADFPAALLGAEDQVGTNPGNVGGIGPNGTAPTLYGGGVLPSIALLPGAAAIDAASNVIAPPTDTRGVARPVDGDQNGLARADSGAYEYVPEFTLTPTPTPLPGDSDRNGCVDLQDFLDLLDFWQTGPNC